MRRQAAGLEGPLRPPRHADQRQQTQDHGHGAERKQLPVLVRIVAGIVDGGGQTEQRLAAGQAHEQRHDVGGQAAVRVAVRLKVHDHEQLVGRDEKGRRISGCSE